MKLAKVLLGAVAVFAISALAPPAPVSGEVKPVTEFVQKKTKAKLGGMTKAQYRKHLRSAMAADNRVRAAIKNASAVKGPYGGRRDKSLHALRHTHGELQALIKHIKSLAK